MYLHLTDAMLYPQGKALLGHSVKLPWALLLDMSDLGVARVLGQVVV